MSTRARWAILGLIPLLFLFFFNFSNIFITEYRSALADLPERFIPLPVLDTADYDLRLLALAHVSTTTLATESSTSPARLWPAKTGYPQAGAMLPFKRIVAYYGNFYSRQMGVLGEYDPDEMLAKLASTTALW
jgi:hypothetical protein